MLLITKHSRFHRAVVSAAALMTVAGGIAEALPLSAEAQTFSYPQPTAPQPARAYPYLQQPPTAQGAYPNGYSYPYYPQPTAPQPAPAYQLHQQQPMAQGTANQLNREELGRLQSGNGYSPYYWASGSPSVWGWGPQSGWGWGSPWGWGWPTGVSVGFGGCWNCGFRGGFFRPGFGRFGFVHPGFGRFGFAHAGFGGGFRGGFHGGGRR